jgi:hypothetical protein
MAFTRTQAKEQQQQQQSQNQPQDFPKNINTTSTSTHKSRPHHIIDFIDASIEWRKNKIKRDNCTFEYI